MDVFTALADQTRRSIMELLASRGQATASDIYANFSVSQPAISQHLKVLREAKLVTVEKRAQQRVYRLNPETLSTLELWVHKFTERVEEQYQELDKLLEREKNKMIPQEENKNG